jgi:hypothetical protein
MRIKSICLRSFNIKTGRDEAPEVSQASQGNPCGICEGQNDTETGFRLLPFSFSIITQTLHICVHTQSTVFGLDTASLYKAQK